MAKFELCDNGNNEGPTYSFHCPGCECDHGVWTNTPNNLTGAKWSFNDDIDKPTVSPSLLVRGYNSIKKNDFICHSFIRNGFIEYLTDCTHHLAGKTIELPEL
jgi:hypothetical protein